jgi:hypothetical protein
LEHFCILLIDLHLKAGLICAGKVLTPGNFSAELSPSHDAYARDAADAWDAWHADA